ncbi:methylated-DNA--[protein]-cysteine S-methyltransferase [Paenibacillus ginsengihumi]|uniref:methylated-DNA--[protein]-cysteine S-methyltransferase n=1 Tax=Paenibacillus ginsengihumi TaxID=431596 RepID=UPI00035DCFB9|nr:methylated-DNA--[protein]-cysteine S-methyltransferase [Paenibacillus ginsengihumi]
MWELKQTTDVIYWDEWTHPAFGQRPLYIAASEAGLCRITWPSESFETLQAWAAKHAPHAGLVRDERRMAAALLQLREYLDGERTEFELALDLRGTPFQVSVWRTLVRIPYGETRSYSDIAAAVERPAAVRAVGAANGANPVPIVVPCHRVIGKNAALTGFRGGLAAKEMLLQREGYREYKSAGHARFRF